MTENLELLTFIHSNAEMGKTTMKQLLGIVENGNFKSLLESQAREYNEIYNISDEKIKGSQEQTKSINPLAKASVYMKINMNTMGNKTPSHISEMLIQGSTMGMIDIIKRIHQYKNADKTDLDLASRLLKFEENNINELKTYLQ